MASKDQKTRLYHPYQDLNVPIQNLYNLPTAPDHLFPEEAARTHRSWGDNLQYYTGTGYLSGALIGAARGTAQGLREAEPADSLKLRLNRVLNSGGHAGRRLGNSLGVLGLIFAGLESGMIHFRATDDLVNSAVAGLGTGALYRAAAIAGAIANSVFRLTDPRFHGRLNMIYRFPVSLASLLLQKWLTG
ncbi:mitochondrial import inner membrane translocase subunit TIM23-1 [Cajanus cajan]|uniref:mitochondrial import inner membrane translocase subunit TIM23-1 n=1 Tax=Cajanus cajan TaxID=3821 RepID=UPI00098DC0B4|nr:mitochondrial import inner membrane translocase subunit TIM23-1 [Cajanus cajan]